MKRNDDLIVSIELNKILRLAMIDHCLLFQVRTRREKILVCFSLSLLIGFVRSCEIHLCFCSRSEVQMGRERANEHETLLLARGSRPIDKHREETSSCLVVHSLATTSRLRSPWREGEKRRMNAKKKLTEGKGCRIVNSFPSFILCPNKSRSSY